MRVSPGRTGRTPTSPFAPWTRVSPSVEGKRTVLHPPGPDRFLGSLGRQRGNQDDPYMTLAHGMDWRQRSGAGRGRRRTHIMTTVVAAVAVGALLGGRRRRLWEWAWLVLTTVTHGVAFATARRRCARSQTCW